MCADHPEMQVETVPQWKMRAVSLKMSWRVNWIRLAWNDTRDVRICQKCIFKCIFKLNFHPVVFKFSNKNKNTLYQTKLKSLALAQTQSTSPKAKPWAKAFH